MGDVYKFAWINVAALSTTSDYDGFINNSRDARVEFGFRASLTSILGRGSEEKNGDSLECVLLSGRAKLLWNSQIASLEVLNPAAYEAFTHY